MRQYLYLRLKGKFCTQMMDKNCNICEYGRYKLAKLLIKMIDINGSKNKKALICLKLGP